MNRSAKKLLKMTVETSDQELGQVESFYFDDERWVIRYLLVNRGSTLSPDMVLISPILIDRVDFEQSRIRLYVDTKAVNNSPDIDTQEPVSRRMEEALVEHYGHSLYWVGNNIWGGYVDPKLLAGKMSPEEEHEMLQAENRDESHLRSFREVTGYRIKTPQGMYGHIDDFLIEEQTWKIIGMVVDRFKLLPHKKMYVETTKINGISWSSSQIDVDMSKEELQQTEEYELAEDSQ